MELWVISQILCFNCISTPSSSDVRGLLNYLHWSAFIVYWVVVQVCLLWTWQLKSLFCIRDEIKVFANVSGYSLNMSCHSHCLYLFIYFITDWIKGLYRHGVWWCPLTVTLTPNSSFEVMKNWTFMQHKFAARAGGCYTDAWPSENWKAVWRYCVTVYCSEAGGCARTCMSMWT